MTLGRFFLEIVNTYKGMRLESASLGSSDYVYFTLVSPNGDKYDFSIHKTEAVKND